ncbi:MAG TPA: hypothetical protein PLD54_02495 [Candidatus Levybacteria bacterium]|nr:hypothetical protein [Candidatus Levybacteria bacterium]
MPFVQKSSKVKNSDKKKADKIYTRLLHYAIYGTMVLGLAIVVVIATQQDSHDTRSQATSDPYVSPMQLTLENQSFENHCYTVNDTHLRTWNGRLEANNSFTIDLPFCTNTSIEDLAFVASTQRPTSFSLSAVSPSGNIIYPSTNQESEKTLCVLPTQRELEKGTWKIVLTAWEDEIDVSDISVVVAPKTSQEITSLCSR